LATALMYEAWRKHQQAQAKMASTPAMAEVAA
jgi:hypothetical protein